MSPPCSNNGCYCDQSCYNYNDCCSDLSDMGCHPPSSSPIVSPIPTHTLGRTKSETHATIKLIYFFISCVCLYISMHSNDKIILNIFQQVFIYQC